MHPHQAERAEALGVVLCCLLHFFFFNDKGAKVNLIKYSGNFQCQRSPARAPVSTVCRERTCWVHSSASLCSRGIIPSLDPLQLRASPYT